MYPYTLLLQGSRNGGISSERWQAERLTASLRSRSSPCTVAIRLWHHTSRLDLRRKGSDLALKRRPAIGFEGVGSLEI